MAKQVENGQFKNYSDFVRSQQLEDGIKSIIEEINEEKPPPTTNSPDSDSLN